MDFRSPIGVEDKFRGNDNYFIGNSLWGLLPKQKISPLIVGSGLRTRHQTAVIIIYAVDCGESTARCIDLGNRPYENRYNTTKIQDLSVLENPLSLGEKCTASMIQTTAMINSIISGQGIFPAAAAESIRFSCLGKI